jgi:hypothetical protein
MRLGNRAAAVLAAVVLAPLAGCGDSDNSKIQTPNDKAIGAPTRGAGQQQNGQQPDGPAGQPNKGRGAPLK